MHWPRAVLMVALLAAAVGSILVTAQGRGSAPLPTGSLGEPTVAGDTPGTGPSGPALVEGDAVPDLLVGPGSGATSSRVLSGVDGTELGSGFPFGATFTGGVRVAAADANGDGVTDIIAGMGPGGSLVRVFSGLDSAEIVSGYPFGQTFAGGVFVAAGDMEGDGRPDVIIGAGAGSGLVRVYTVDAVLLFSFAPFGPGYTGGVQVAAGDVDGDGRADLIAAQAAGGLVKVFSAAAQSTLATGFPYGPAFAGGVSVAAGDVDGDGRAEVIVAPATGSGPVHVYDALSQTVLATLMPYGAALTGGMRVATADFDGDGRAEVIAAPGPGALSLVSIYSGGTLAPYASINVFPAEFAGGVFVAAPTAIGTRFVTADRASFTAGAPGTFTVRAVGAPPVTTITHTGTLPAGITFTDHGDGTATLAGTPTGSAGDFGLTFTATNGATPPAMQAFTLTVQEAPAITSAAATTFGLGGPGSFTVTTTGFPLPTVSSTGALPAGVTFTPNTDGTATLAGTPAPGSGGVYPLTITATNGIGAAATQEFVLTIDASPAFTSADTAAFDVGTPGTFAIVTTATPAVTSITSVGTTPPGLSFVDNGNGTATLAGVPTAAGIYTLALTATNGVGTDAVQTLTVTVREAPAITSAASTVFMVESAGTFTVTATGTPTASLTSTGALPAGVVFTDNGDGTATLAGTPAPGTGGSYALSIAATNGVGVPVVQPFTLTVNAAPTFTSSAAAAFVVGTAGTFTVTTSGTPDVATIAAVGPLPAGVLFTDHGDGTATIAGTPGVGLGSDYPITLTATNGIGAPAVQNFTLTVNEAPGITSTNTASFDLATPGTFDVTTSGFPVPEISSAGTLPAGVSFVDNADGTATLSGTPGAATAGDYPLLLTAANGVGTAATQNFTLSVICPAVSLSPPAGVLPPGTYGTAYSQTFTATGGSGHTFAVTAGALPAGLTLSGSGALTGSPANSGTFTFTVTATNTAGCDDAAAYGLAVSPDAQDESYSNGVGNTQYSVGAGTPSTPAVVVSGTVLSNDLGPSPLSAGPASIATPNGGQVAMAANGTFLYTPATGFAGPSDTFTYMLTDGNGLTDLAAVTINLSDLVWYVNGSAGGGGTGRSHQPLDTLTAADTASAANSVVYVHAGSPSGGITLDAGQTLWGAGAAFALNGLSIASAAKPTLGGTVTIAGDNVTITSVAISTGSSTGVTNTGTRTGLTITNGVTVATTTGTAVSLSNVESTAGASPAFGINFQSVSSNGAPNAIVLNGVNTASGSFAVTGTGSAGSGGTVQNTTGDSVTLTNTRNVSLSSMVVQNSQESGLLGAGVTSLTLAGCTFTNNGNDSGDVGIHLTNLWGTSALSNVSVTGSALANVFIDNDSGTLTSLAISGTSSFSNLGTAFGGNSMLVQMRGTAVMTAGSIVGAAFADNGLARGLTVQSQEAATISDFLVQGNTFTNNGLHTSFEQSGTADLTFRLVNNSPMTGSAPLQAVNVFSSSISTGGTIRGRIQGNTIGNASVDGSGSTAGQGIRVLVQGATGATLLVDGNTIREAPNGRGIDMQFLGPLAASPGVTHDVTVTNNDVDHINLPYQPGSSDFPLAGIYVAADSQGGAPVTVRANISGNTVPSTEAFDAFDAHLIFDEVVAAGTCQLVGAAADATAQLTGTNTGSAQAAAGCTLIPGPIVTPP